MEKVIIFHEKHDEPLYDVSTREQLLTVLLKKMHERYKNGWYDFEPTDLDKAYPMSLVTEEMLLDVPEDAKKIILEQALTEKYRREKVRKHEAQEKQEFSWVKKLVELYETSKTDEAIIMRVPIKKPGTGKGYNAIEYLMESRKTFEYENYTIRAIG